jgi:hypothetical protein
VPRRVNLTKFNSRLKYEKPSVSVIVTSSEIRKALIASGISNLPTSSNTIRKKVEYYYDHIQQQMVLKISLLKKDSKKFSICFDEYTSCSNRK